MTYKEYISKRSEILDAINAIRNTPNYNKESKEKLIKINYDSLMKIDEEWRKIKNENKTKK